MNNGMHNMEFGDLEDYFEAPDELQDADNVCAQCKHFYVRVDKGNGCTSGLAEYVLNASPDDARNADEIRLCYEIHWCNAATPVCDNDFEPLGDVEMSQPDAKLMFDNFNAKYPDVRETIRKAVSPKPNTEPQKEIQYVYIGLLQEDQDVVRGTLKEVPTEIDGVATNYRRVEMTPLDWGFCNSKSPAAIDFQNPDIAVNGVDIDFPVAQTDWNNIQHFGVYDSPIGGRLICTSEFAIRWTILSSNCAIMDIGSAEIPLKHLLSEKKGGK